MQLPSGYSPSFEAKQFESKMTRQNRHWLIWFLPFSLILNLSSASIPDLFAENFFQGDPSRNLTIAKTLPTKLPNVSSQLEEWYINCSDHWFCSAFSARNKLCFCDDLCFLFGDCCEGKFNTTKISFSQSTRINNNTIPEETSLTSTQQLNKPLAKHLYECNYDGYVSANIYTVFGCPVEYTNKYIRKQCEQPEKIDRLLHVTVSGVFPKLPKYTASVKFYNFYCAICHGLTDYRFWNPILSCKVDRGPFQIFPGNETETTDSPEEDSNCFLLEFELPENETLRECEIIIDECPRDKSDDEASRCVNGPFQPIAARDRIFKNNHCALCHNVEMQLISCIQFHFYVHAGSFANLYNFLSTKLFISKCDETSLYDPYTRNCRPIHIPRFCNESNLIIDDPTIPCPDCQLIRLNENEYNISGDFIRLEKSVVTINKSLLHYIDDKVYICSEHYIVKKESANIDQSDQVELYITWFGVSLSMLVLFVTFCVYAKFRSLRNVPGKMSMNLMASMFFANLLFLVNDFKAICIVVAVCMHYVYLVSFFWMNALSFDAWNTFSKTSIGGRSKNSYKYYLIYCWMTPLLIVSVSIFVQFSRIDIFRLWLSPNYGPPFCWISNKWSLLIFFVAPLFLLILCNLVFYGLTIRAIYRTEKFSNRLLSKKNKGMFLIYLKLCFIMGMTWLFALLHTFTGIKIISYLSVFLNSFQGFWVGCSYLFSNQVCRKLKEKFAFIFRSSEHKDSDLSGSKQTSGTYLSSLKSGIGADKFMGKT